MPFTIRCGNCGQTLNVPDQLAGQVVQCPGCQGPIQVDVPLMPPSLADGSGVSTGTSPAPVPPIAPSPQAPPPAPAAGLSLSVPPFAEPAAPPAFTVSDEQAASVDAFHSDIVERAVKKSQPNTVAWVFSTLILGVIVVGGLYVALTRMETVNPSPSEVAERLPPADEALNKLGERQSALGYSLRLPEGFARGVPPSTDGLPAGSQSYSWAAADGALDEGSFLHLIVIAKKSNILKELHRLHSIGDQASFPATIVNKSVYRRIGDHDLVAVRGLLEGQRDGQPGVVYFVADGDRTLIVIGAGSGRKAANVQYLLDHAVRTLRRTR